MKTNGIGQRIAAATVVAVGVAVLWGLVAAWTAILARTVLPDREASSESLLVAIDGTPVIATQSNEAGSSLTVARRTIDGKPFPLDYEDWMGSVYFHPPNRPPGLFELPVTWTFGNGRIAGVSDGKLPPTGWYFIRDGEPNGHMYVAGFDAFSKLPVGYIGREGFRATKPPRSEHFAVPSTANREYQELSQVLVSTQRLEFKVMVRNHRLWDGETPPQWHVHLLERDRLWEIDLRQRTARSVARFNGAMAISLTYLKKAMFDQLDWPAPAAQAEIAPRDVPNSDETEAAPADSAEEEAPAQEYAIVMAVREPDRLIYFDLSTGKRQVFLLPEKLRDRRMSVFLLSADQLLIFAHEQYFEYWSGGPITRLIWTDRQGKINRETEVKLAGWVPDSPSTKAWKLAAVGPVPIAWLVGATIVDPLLQVQANNAANYAAAMRNTFVVAWLPFVVVFVLAVVVVWIAVGFHRQNFRRGLGWWMAFVFLFGPAGLIAYWLEHRRPKLETCRECGRTVPRDRDVCAACQAPFAPPSPVGTEIFA